MRKSYLSRSRIDPSPRSSFPFLFFGLFFLAEYIFSKLTYIGLELPRLANCINKSELNDLIVNNLQQLYF